MSACNHVLEPHKLFKTVSVFFEKLKIYDGFNFSSKFLMNFYKNGQSAAILKIIKI